MRKTLQHCSTIANALIIHIERNDKKLHAA